jgi:hypothetical protein
MKKNIPPQITIADNNKRALISYYSIYSPVFTIDRGESIKFRQIEAVLRGITNNIKLNSRND